MAIEITEQQRKDLKLDKLGETFSEFFVETGAIPGSENHQEFLDTKVETTRIKIYPAYGDFEATGWMDKEY